MPQLRFFGGKHHNKVYNVGATVNTWSVLDRTDDYLSTDVTSQLAKNLKSTYSTYKKQAIVQDGCEIIIMIPADFNTAMLTNQQLLVDWLNGKEVKFESMETEIKLRWYQEEAVDEAMAYFDDYDGHPIIVVPTGAGKTIIMCEFINQYLSDYPGSKVLVLSHVKEILEQDFNALEKYFEGYDVGLYSAGLGSRTKKNITVAGIQSVYNKPELFDDVNIVIIDECHLIGMKDEGMYRSFLDKLKKANYVGLTATHFRLGHGYIHEGPKALFTDVIYDLSSMDNFNRLVDEGYLSKLISKATEYELDTSEVRTRGGDFRLDDLSNIFDRESITVKAVAEIIKYGKNYSAWLIFAIDIAHAEHITAELNSSGIKTACVHSKMEGDRSEIIDAYKRGDYRAMVNVDILTTGFDVLHIDLIAMLRPTQSPVLHVQAIGRGLRVVYKEGMPIDTIEERQAAIEASRKTHCLVLDFAGNTERLGPINNVIVRKKGESKNKGEPITKRCPDCGVIHHPTVKECDICGHIFLFKQKIRGNAGNSDIVQESPVAWYDVDRINYYIHQKKGKPSSLRVEYSCGLFTFKEWVCYDHPPGWAKHKAKAWVRFRLFPKEMPKDLQELYARCDELRVPTKIKVDTAAKFTNIQDSKFA